MTIWQTNQSKQLTRFRKAKHSYSITYLRKTARKIPRVKIDGKLNFKSHMSELCKKPSQKILVLSRLSSYLHNSEKKLILNSMIKSQFSYCSLVWMLSSRTSNNMINKLHERSLRIILNGYSSILKYILLENNNDICNHHRNIQALLL